MRYPIYPSTIMNGSLPSMVEMGPPDLRPTSSTAGRYQERLDRMFGRNLAGLGADAEKNVGEDREPAYALNELRVMAELDDTDGAGIFDAPGTVPNNYPDAGVFSNNWAWPGYLMRERMYSPSEVVDSTTGRRIIPVNGGTVSMDSAAQIAFIEAGRYNPPRPVMDQYSEVPVEYESTANVRQNPAPITPTSGYGEAAVVEPQASSAKTLLIALGVGALGVGAAYALLKPKRTANRRRR